jgi:hypothetical protein
MTQQFFLVPIRGGQYVEAKTLVDAFGNDIISPRTGQAYVVPKDYNMNYGDSALN